MKGFKEKVKQHEKKKQYMKTFRSEVIECLAAKNNVTERIR